MRQSRSSLNSEVKQSKKGYEEKSLASKFGVIIAKQQEVIQSLSDQILLLKSYITLDKVNHPFDVNCSDISINNTSTSSSESHIKGELEEAVNQCNKKHDYFLKKLASILQITANDNIDEENLISNINKLKQSLKQNKEIVFVEKYKEVKVPIVIEKEVEKIVYIQKQPQSNTQKTSAKEKYMEKSRQQEERNLNKTYSQKNLRQKRDEERYYDSRNDQRQDRQKYDPYRRNEPIGNTLIKKRGDYGKQYYRKKY